MNKTIYLLSLLYVHIAYFVEQHADLIITFISLDLDFYHFDIFTLYGMSTKLFRF